MSPEVPQAKVNADDIDDLEDDLTQVQRELRILLATQVLLAAKATGIPIDSFWSILFSVL